VLVADEVAAAASLIMGQAAEASKQLSFRAFYWPGKFRRALGREKRPYRLSSPPSQSTARTRASPIRPRPHRHSMMMQFVEYEMAVFERLIGVGQRPVAHGRKRVKRIGRKEPERRLNDE
jgi:hypothetical protein